MDFHFITLKSGGTATILDGLEKPRFICFKELYHADKYAAYICEHKAKFGTWPTVNLSCPFIKARVIEGHRDMDALCYKSLIDIVHRDEDDITNISLLTGVNYFYCHMFEYEDLLSMNMRGQDIDGHVDEFMYRENMDFNLKNM